MAALHRGDTGQSARITIERRDWIKIGGFVFVIVTAAVSGVAALMTNVFQNHDAATLEHAEIRHEAKLHKQRLDMQRGFDEQLDGRRDGQIKDNTEILTTIHINQKTIMHQMDIGRRRIKQLPKGVSDRLGP